MRGGAHEPLTRADIEDKFMLNAQHGGHRFGAREGCLGYRSRHVQRADRPVGIQRVGDVEHRREPPVTLPKFHYGFVVAGVTFWSC